MTNRARIAVLISGTGSNMKAILAACQRGDIPGDIVAVISNRPGAKGLDTAAAAGVATAVVDHKHYASREDFDQALAAEIDRFCPDLVVLAGFMRILNPDFVRHYRGRLLNIHPSLLPKYPGLHTHQRAIDAGDPEAGATVHFVTEELDGGPAIVQGSVPIHAGDNADTLAARVLPLEHSIYPLAVTLFCQGRVRLSESGATLDGQLLPPSGLKPESLNATT